MFAYIVRRLLYAIPILIGVNIITFGLFFAVNSANDVAENMIGGKHVTEQQIEDWKKELEFKKSNRGELKEAEIFIVDVVDPGDGTQIVSYKVHIKVAKEEKATDSWRLDDDYMASKVPLQSSQGKWKIKNK